MTTSSSSVTLHLTITAQAGAPRVPLQVDDGASLTCAQLRVRVSTTTKIPLSTLKLIFRGRLIPHDEAKLVMGEFKLEDGSVLHCMGKPATADTGNSSSSTATPAATASPDAIQAALVAATAATTAPAAAPAAASAPAADPLSTALQTLRSSNPAAAYTTGVQTLQKILANIVKNPMEEKYRRVKQGNAAFQRRLGGLVGAPAVLHAAGFVTATENNEAVYLLQASPEAWPQLMQAQATVEQAVQQATSATNPTTTNSPPSAAASAGLGGMPLGGGMGGMMPPSMGSPEMQAAAANLMANPAALQTMLQNPMVQNMMRNDPRFANNPMMQNMLQQMASNPAMLQQVSQMMQDPTVLQRMQQMMAAQGGTMGGGMPSPFAAPAVPNAGAPPAAGQPPQRSDEDLTEEEMIAEAIRRSLQDGSGGGGSS